MAKIRWRELILKTVNGFNWYCVTEELISGIDKMAALQWLWMDGWVRVEIDEPFVEEWKVGDEKEGGNIVMIILSIAIYCRCSSLAGVCRIG